MRRALLLSLPIVQLFVPRGTTMPAADFCRTVRVDRPTFSSDSETCGRPPEVSSTAFNAQPPNLEPALLKDVDFAFTGQLVRRRRPHIRFLSIGSRLCSTLPSDPTSRWRPCASLTLDLHPVGKRTYTSKLSIMDGVPGQAESVPTLRAVLLHKTVWPAASQGVDSFQSCLCLFLP
jgi:hypothetical protein